jgi:flagellar basal-body rod modification protein FlgD
VTTTTSATGAASAGAAAATQATTAKNGLVTNYSDFLKLLMTQLQNQDPTSPMDTNQFTTQLVQYSAVEQQINANSNLSKLIDLQQGSQMIESSSVLGKTVQYTSDQLSLQNGSATMKLTPATADTVTVDISDSSGKVLRQVAVPANTGGTSWTWDGKDSHGNTLADGSYAVTAKDSSGGTVPFSLTGKATGVQQSSTGVALQIGTLGVPFTAITQLGS